MSIIRDDAVVLQRVDYSETSQVAVFLTREHGKVRAIAKGIKRGTKNRFAVGIDLLDVGTLVLRSRGQRSANLANLTEWKQTQSLGGLREKLFRLYGAQYAAEVTTRLTEDWDPHAALFDALVSALTDLSSASEPLEPIVRYQSQLLKAVGSSPRFDACMTCARSEDLTHFSSIEGGMICRHCESTHLEKREVSKTTLNVLLKDSIRPKSPALARADSHRQSDDSNRVSFGSMRGESAAAPVGPFDILNYHIAHLSGREPLLAAKLVPAAQRRVLD